MTHKIFDANDKALEEHKIEPRATFTNHRGRILFDWNKLISPIHRQRTLPVWGGVEGNENHVIAYIDAGRWLAMCQCGNIEYVTASDPIFFCHNCGNKDVDGKSKPVIFPKPEYVAMIENAMLKREVELDSQEMNPSPIVQARSARYVTKPRAWKPR